MMYTFYSRRGETQKNYHKTKSHSRMLLAGIPTLDTQSGVDPRLQASGMTTNLNVGQVLPDNKGCSLRPLRSLVHRANFSAPLAGEVRRSRVLKNISTASEKVKARMRGCSLFSLINPSPALRAFPDYDLAGRRLPARGEENGARGFTLIELLIVVLIIGILAAVALPQYQFAVLKSRFVQAKLMVIELARAEELYYLANGEYSPSMAN